MRLSPMVVALLSIGASAQAASLKPLLDELPARSLPLSLSAGNLPRDAKVSPSNLAALRETLAAWANGAGGRIDGRLEEVTDDKASPPLLVGFKALGRVTVAGQAGILCEFTRTAGPGGPDDDVTDGVFLVTVSPAGTLIDAGYLYSWESDGGERRGLLQANGKIKRGELTQQAQEGPPTITGPALVEQVLPGGTICPVEAKRVVVGTFRDPKTKEQLTLADECEHRSSVSYSAGPRKPVQWMVITNPGAKILEAQFPTSPKVYLLELTGGTIRCTNPDKTVQIFERAP